MSESAPSLRRVKNGVGMVFAGLVLLMLLTFGMLAVTGYPGESILGTEWAPLLLPLAGLFLAMQIVGQLQCLSVPPESRARWPLGVSLMLTLAAVPLSLLVLLPNPPRWADLLPSLASNAAHVAFLLFLRRLAAYIGEGDLEIRAERVLTCWVLLFFLPYLILLGLLAFPLVTTAVVTALFLVFLVFPLIVLILYVNLILDLFHALRRHEDARLAKEKQVKAGWVDQPPW